MFRDFFFPDTNASPHAVRDTRKSPERSKKKKFTIIIVLFIKNPHSA